MPVERRQRAPCGNLSLFSLRRANAHLAFADSVERDPPHRPPGPAASEVVATLTRVKVRRSRPCYAVSNPLKGHTMNSVHDARWLLGSVFALAIIMAGIGLAVG
jgi:hypothetical protein